MTTAAYRVANLVSLGKLCYVMLWCRYLFFLKVLADSMVSCGMRGPEHAGSMQETCRTWALSVSRKGYLIPSFYGRERCPAHRLYDDDFETPPPPSAQHLRKLQTAGQEPSYGPPSRRATNIQEAQTAIQKNGQEFQKPNVHPKPWCRIYEFWASGLKV